MEKRTPHYPLARVKALIRAGAYRITGTALDGALQDFDMANAAEVACFVLEVEAQDFYKSMTSLKNHTVWQDVYHPWLGGGAVYLKLQIVDDETAIISFKHRD